MKFICPLPSLWNEIYEHLYSAWQDSGSKGSPPPIPLILNGWVYSNDGEKKDRWKSTLEWAHENGLKSLIPDIETKQSYMVSNLTTHATSPMGGPMFLEWNYSPKITPSEEEVNSALQLLSSKWQDIVGNELALHTKPIKFTGKKRRRLLVHADPNFHPSWGTWDKLLLNEKRHSFTQFRKAINDHINPLMVDHVEFVLSDES